MHFTDTPVQNSLTDIKPFTFTEQSRSEVGLEIRRDGAGVCLELTQCHVSCLLTVSEPAHLKISVFIY